MSSFFLLISLYSKNREGDLSSGPSVVDVCDSYVDVNNEKVRYSNIIVDSLDVEPSSSAT
jgi:hypothetical protein